VSAMFVACVVSVGVGVAAQGEPATQSQQPATQSAPPAAQSPQPAAESQQPAPEAQGPAEQRRQPPPASPRAAQDKVTISGCIQNAPAPPAGAAASASASASSTFVLAKGKMVSGAAGNAAVGTTGTTAAGTQYRLEGDDKALSPHLNHQVEITGTVQNSLASATGAANVAPGSAAAGPTLKVDSVKMVSANCQ